MNVKGRSQASLNMGPNTDTLRHPIAARPSCASRRATLRQRAQMAGKGNTMANVWWPIISIFAIAGPIIVGCGSAPRVLGSGVRQVAWLPGSRWPICRRANFNRDPEGKRLGIIFCAAVRRRCEGRGARGVGGGTRGASWHRQSVEVTLSNNTFRGDGPLGRAIS